jgi:hypothetical protein
MLSLLPTNPPPRQQKTEEEPDFASWPVSAVEDALDKLLVTDDPPSKWRALFQSVNHQTGALVAP